MLYEFSIILNLVGTILVVVPNVSFLFQQFHRIPPLSSIHKGEEKLYREGEISREDTGFGHITKALWNSSQPYDRSGGEGVFQQYGAEFEIDEGTVHFDYRDCQIEGISKIDEKVLSNSDFQVVLVPGDEEGLRKLRETHQNHSLNALMTIIPSGKLPETVRQYKRNLFLKTGAGVLAVGLSIQLLLRLS